MKIEEIDRLVQKYWYRLHLMEGRVRIPAMPHRFSIRERGRPTRFMMRIKLIANGVSPAELKGKNLRSLYRSRYGTAPLRVQYTLGSENVWRIHF